MNEISDAHSDRVASGVKPAETGYRVGDQNKGLREEEPDRQPPALPSGIRQASSE